MCSKSWIEVSLRVAPADADAVADVLGHLAGSGVVIEPEINPSDDVDHGYEVRDTATTVRAFFDAPLSAIERRSLRRHLIEIPLIEPLPRLRFANVSDRDWSEEWKRFFDVLHVGERLVLCPSWRSYSPASGELVIEIDPGRAFGTGQHATTQLCLEALERYVQEGDNVIDVGVGSGILSIAAGKLGAQSVRGLDTDIEVIPVARENVARNDMKNVVDVAFGSLADEQSVQEEPRLVDLVVVNISAGVLVDLMSDVALALRPGGLLVGSGFIEDTASDVFSAATAAGLKPLNMHAEEEWRCMVAQAL